MKVKLAFSTCPNDTFIFNALLNRAIDVENYQFDAILTDIQELNELALNAQVDMVKISYALYPQISANYQLLTAGSALGSGVGPLVVSKRKIYPDEVRHAKIAIPGKTTTANFLFSLAFPEALDKKVYLFSDIEEAVLDNEMDVGVLIHEGRFTYAQKGLQKIMDLGEFWEQETSSPIPLGGIAVRRDLPDTVKSTLNSLTKLSIEHALKHPDLAMPFIKKYAQEMRDDVVASHINLYVNDYSVYLGSKGKQAIMRMFEEALKQEQYKNCNITEPLYVD